MAYLCQYCDHPATTTLHEEPVCVYCATALGRPRKAQEAETVSQEDAAARAAGWDPVTLSPWQVACLAQSLLEWQRVGDDYYQAANKRAFSREDRRESVTYRNCLESLKPVFGRAQIREWLARVAQEQDTGETEGRDDA